MHYMGVLGQDSVPILLVWRKYGGKEKGYMKQLLSLLMIIAASCNNIESSPIVTDLELTPFIEDFERTFGVDYKGSYFMAALDDNLAGLCTTWSNGDARIMIDYDYWQTLSFNQKEVLVWHELGHCVLYLDHNNSSIIISGNNRPASVMRSIIFNRVEAGDFDLFRSYYIQELR